MKTFLSLAALFLVGTLIISLGLAVAQQPGEGQLPGAEPKLPAVQKYVPDRETPWEPDWKPDPDRARTIYAERIVLRGARCEIVIDATSRAPGIFVKDLRSGERAVLYIDGQGSAAMGVSTPARRELAAGLFSGEQMGCVQLSDRTGIHIFSGRELANRSFGALKE